MLVEFILFLQIFPGFHNSWVDHLTLKFAFFFLFFLGMASISCAFVVGSDQMLVEFCSGGFSFLLESTIYTSIVYIYIFVVGRWTAKLTAHSYNSFLSGVVSSGPMLA